jgi:antitoxin ParD1/3/4
VIRAHANFAAPIAGKPGRELTIDDIYSRMAKMNVALTKHFEELIARLIASGRYNNSSEVVRAGLRILDAEERALSAAAYPPGSLRHLYTKAENRAERLTAKASTLKVEAE